MFFFRERAGAARRKRFRRYRCASRRRCRCRWRERGGNRRRRQHCLDRDPRRQRSGETSAIVATVTAAPYTFWLLPTSPTLNLNSLSHRTRGPGAFASFSFVCWPRSRRLEMVARGQTFYCYCSYTIHEPWMFCSILYTIYSMLQCYIDIASIRSYSALYHSSSTFSFVLDHFGLVNPSYGLRIMVLRAAAAHAPSQAQRLKIMCLNIPKFASARIESVVL